MSTQVHTRPSKMDLQVHRSGVFNLSLLVSPFGKGVR